MAAVAVAVASSCPSSACASASRWSLSPSASASASASDPRLGFFAAPAGLKFAGLLWKNKSDRRTARPAASPIRVVAAAAAAAAPAAEEAAGPVVTTETVPRPKKIGKGIVRLRLARFGRKKRPFFRIVATHYSRQRDGKYIELLGHYDPLHAKDVLGIVVKADRIKYWLGVGAQPSDTVTGILHKVGILKKEVPAVAQ